MGKNFGAIAEYKPTKARVTAYVEEIFPSIVEIWGKVLKVHSPLQNIVPQPLACGETASSMIPQHHFEEGVANADTMIYVQMRDSSSCSVDPKPRITICNFDQHMRPLIGSLSICLEDMVVQKDKVHESEVLHHTALLSQLLGRFLGLSPNLFQYFRDPATGQLWGERKVDIACGIGNTQVSQEIMLSNIIQQRTVRDADPYYEISTPTVKQVVRNQFDCQTLTGARLDGPTSSNPKEECAFFNLDLRYHFDEDMTSLSQNADAAFGVSPLSLALLEDSSWYQANFAEATTPTFGRGAGCGFVESSCIAGGNVPDYSVGYFCASHERLPGTRSGCDYTHHSKAGCDLEDDVSPPLEEHRYFLPSNPEFGSPFDDVDYCPMRSKHLVPCSSSNGSKGASLAGESFEENSRCYETDASIPVCLETVCNRSDKTLSVVVKGKSFYCAYQGQVINVEVGYSVVCPRIAAVCPDLVCPSNCSGKGLCDYCKEVPECICDSPFDQSDGCWNS
jgi:leishmanolysin-like peptidase